MDDNGGGVGMKLVTSLKRDISRRISLFFVSIKGFFRSQHEVCCDSLCLWPSGYSGDG